MKIIQYVISLADRYATALLQMCDAFVVVYTAEI